MDMLLECVTVSMFCSSDGFSFSCSTWCKQKNKMLLLPHQSHSSNSFRLQSVLGLLCRTQNKKNSFETASAPADYYKKKIIECPCHFRQFGLIHRPNYLTLRNKWGLTTTLTKSAVSFFRCHLSESPRDLLAIRVDKYLLGCFALYIVLSNVVYASTLWA